MFEQSGVVSILVEHGQDPDRGLSHYNKANSFNHRIAHTCGLGDTVKLVERGIDIRLAPKNACDNNLAARLLHDRRTQTFDCKAPNLDLIFARGIPTPSETIPVRAKDSNPREVLRHANRMLGLALGEPEIELFVEACSTDDSIARDFTCTDCT